MKILTLLIAGMMVFALCACSKTETVVITPEPAAVETPQTEPPQTEAPVPETEDPLLVQAR